MPLVGALGDGDDLQSAEVLIDLGFAQAQVSIPPSQGENAGALAYDGSSPGLPTIELGNLNKDDLGCTLYSLLYLFHMIHPFNTYAISHLFMLYLIYWSNALIFLLQSCQAVPLPSLNLQIATRTCSQMMT